MENIGCVTSSAYHPCVCICREFVTIKTRERITSIKNPKQKDQNILHLLVGTIGTLDDSQEKPVICNESHLNHTACGHSLQLQ